MILYTGNPKVSTPKLLGLINEFSEVTGYNINIQESVASLYTNNELSERECKKKITFKITSKILKYQTRDIENKGYGNCKKENVTIDQNTLEKLHGRG